MSTVRSPGHKRQSEALTAKLSPTPLNQRLPIGQIETRGQSIIVGLCLQYMPREDLNKRLTRVPITGTLCAYGPITMITQVIKLMSEKL